MTDKIDEVPKEFGPVYPDLGQKVARLRRGKDRKAHGTAVLDAIRGKQRGELRRETPSHAIQCASGTSHPAGKEILKAIAARHRAALLNAPAQERRARTADEWRELYEAAMKEKNNDRRRVEKRARPDR
jgi:hypothetical protein